MGFEIYAQLEGGIGEDKRNSKLSKIFGFRRGKTKGEITSDEQRMIVHEYVERTGFLW